VAAGYELALAATLGGSLTAAVVADRAAAQAVVERAGEEGARALVLGRNSTPPAPGPPPVPGARALVELLSGEEAVLALAARLLADNWVVEDLAALAGGLHRRRRDPRGARLERRPR